MNEKFIHAFISKNRPKSAEMQQPNSPSKVFLFQQYSTVLYIPKNIAMKFEIIFTLSQLEHVVKITLQQI